MKKLVSLLLSLIILMSMSLGSVYAEVQPENLYEERFIEKIGYPMFYQEEYVHITENGNVDWVFVAACTVMAIVDPLPGVDATSYYRNCGLLFGDIDQYWPFNIGFCVYDVEKDEFLDVTTLNIDEYIGLRDFVIENDLAFVIGDVNFDKEVTIEDATWIQKIEAKCSIGGRPMDRELNDRAHDFNNDGVANIIDATAIQMKLAKFSE